MVWVWLVLAVIGMAFEAEVVTVATCLLAAVVTRVGDDIIEAIRGERK